MTSSPPEGEWVLAPDIADALSDEACKEIAANVFTKDTANTQMGTNFGRSMIRSVVVQLLAAGYVIERREGK